MQYLCLIYWAESRVEILPECEYDALMRDILDHRDDVQQGGNHLAATTLQPVRTATTIRVRNGMMSITDGPFAETDEQLGGFCLIEARDLNDAIRVASKLPPARLGSIEIRPVQEQPEGARVPTTSSSTKTPTTDRHAFRLGAIADLPGQ